MTLGSIWAEWVSVRANSHPLNSSTKSYWFYLCAICVRALIKTGKPSALISALHSRKGQRGKVVSASDSGSGGRGFDSQPSHVVIALGKQFTLTFPSPPTCKMGTQLQAMSL